MENRAQVFIAAPGKPWGRPPGALAQCTDESLELKTDWSGGRRLKEIFVTRGLSLPEEGAGTFFKGVRVTICKSRRGKGLESPA